MNKWLKRFLYSLIYIHLAVIIIELYVALINYSGDNFSNRFIKNYAMTHKEELFNGFYKQLLDAVLNLFKLCIFLLILYISSNLKFLKDDIENNEPTITYNNVSLPISTSNEAFQNSLEEELPQENEVTEDPVYSAINRKEYVEEDLGLSMNQIQSENSVASNIILYLGTEKNVLVFISYCYIIGEYIRFFFRLKTFLFFLIVPYIYYAMNIKFYKKYRLTKCFFFNVYVGIIFTIFFFFYSLLNFRVERVDVSILPKEIQEWFFDNNVMVFIDKIKTEKVNVGIVGFSGVVFLEIFGDWDILTKDEKISVLFHEIGHYVNNSLLYRLIIGKSNTIILMSLEIILLKLSKFIVSDKITRIGSYFVTFILINITFLPLITTVNNLYFQKDEIEADNFSVKNHDKIYLAKSLIKIILYTQSSFNHSYLYSLFYHSHPTLGRRLENIGIN